MSSALERSAQGEFKRHRTPSISRLRWMFMRVRLPYLEASTSGLHLWVHLMAFRNHICSLHQELVCEVALQWGIHKIGRRWLFYYSFRVYLSSLYALVGSLEANVEPLLANSVLYSFIHHSYYRGILGSQYLSPYLMCMLPYFQRWGYFVCLCFHMWFVGILG